MAYAPKIKNIERRTELVVQYTAAERAVLEASKTVQLCIPLACDYQIINEPTLYSLALQQHTQWLEQLADIHKQLEEVAIDILSQQLKGD